jgi:TRAP-type C4-dicarboxylate transport system substrate-binding protein
MSSLGMAVPPGMVGAEAPGSRSGTIASIGQDGRRVSRRESVVMAPTAATLRPTLPAVKISLRFAAVAPYRRAEVSLLGGISMKRTVLAATAAAALVAGSAPASAATTFTYASWVPLTHPINVFLYLPWIKKVEAASKGAIKFRILPKNVVHPRAYLDAVRTGQIDSGFGVFGYSPKRFASYHFADLPGGGDRAIAGSVALQMTQDKFFAHKNFFAGTHLIGLNTHGPGLIFTRNKFIKKPSDMKGLKIRTGGPIPRRIVEAWGGVSIRAPAPKSYEILSTGIADGITFPWESLVSFKITNLVTYATYIPGGLYSSGFFFVISKKKYDGLSPAGKKAIDKYSDLAYARMAGKAWDKDNDIGKAAAIKNHNHIMTAPKAVIDAVNKMNKKFEAEYIAAAKKQGVDGAAVLKYFRAEVAKLQGK